MAPAMIAPSRRRTWRSRRRETGTVEIAGPERAPFNEIVARYLRVVGNPRKVVSDPEARYFGGRSTETASCVASNRARSEVSIRVLLHLAEGYLNGRLAVPIEAHDT